MNDLTRQKYEKNHPKFQRLRAQRWHLREEGMKNKIVSLTSLQTYQQDHQYAFYRKKAVKRELQASQLLQPILTPMREIRSIQLEN
jgi:hypothetical protein